MINYSELSNEELNKLAGEKIMGWKLMLVADDSGVLYDGAEFENYVADNGEGCGMFSPDDWNPCDKDSAQAERYLFPKLRGRGANIILDYFDQTIINSCHNDFDIHIGFSDCTFKGGTSDPDQINRTKVIACLEAWEKLK